MAKAALDELLTTLDVRVHAVATCAVCSGHRLVFDPMGMVTVHYVLKGSGVMQVRGQSPAIFRSKSVLIIPPGGRVTLATHGETRDVPAAEAGRLGPDGLLVFGAGEGEPDLLIASGTITATFAGGFGLFDRLSEPLVEEVEHIHFLSAAIDLLLDETRAPGFATRAFTEALMRQCLLLVLRSHFNRSGPESPLFTHLGDERLVRSLSRVLVEPGGQHTLATLAGEAGMSRSAFANRFAEAFGQTPFEFVLRVRLRHAAHLLRATDLPVKMIADAAGFASRSHFSRAFRAAFGRDPSSYRELRALADGVTVPFIKTGGEDEA